MTLIEIKKYLQQVKMASLATICQQFNADPERMRCMLRHWMQKGNVRQCVKKPACGSKCFKCPSSTIEIYEWVEVLGAAVIL